MCTKRWRGGMIGAGAWSDIQLNAWAAVKNADIVALCDRHPERRDPVAQRFRIPQVYDDFESMLDQADLDFVDICTRPYSHKPLIEQTIARKLPVLCQKPFCESLKEARDVVTQCSKAGVRLMVNENYRWQSWFRKAKSIIESGALGTPFIARIERRTRFTLPTFEDSQAYFTDMPQLIVYEMGVHYLDTLRYLLGEPGSVYARVHHISPHMQGEDAAVITLGYENMTCVINQSWASVQVPGLDKPEDNGTGVPRLEVDGTLGTLSLNCYGTLSLTTDTDRQQWDFSDDAMPESRMAAQQHFIDCLESGDEFETSGEETLKTMALVYGCYQSAAEKRVVDVPCL